MKVIVTGGTGFIGTRLIPLLQEAGHQVLVFTRGSGAGVPHGAQAVTWSAGANGAGGQGQVGQAWQEALDGAGAVIHLAGESIGGRRWSPEQKDRIRDSRVHATRQLVAAMGTVRQPPEVLISASGVDYYELDGDEEVTEEAPPGDAFLARVCVAWEAEAKAARDLGVRVVITRNGVVLAGDGGALPRMLLPFRLFVGGPLGSGEQWMSWIHWRDHVRLLHFLLENEEAQGPVNAVAPQPVTNGEFTRALGHVMGRPAWLPAPAFALRLALGEMADALLLNGRRVVPERAQALGFEFEHPQLEPALRAVLEEVTA